MTDQDRSVQINCKSCGGSGIYVGWAEVSDPSGDLGIVCTTCHGTGADWILESLMHPIHNYTAYEGRRPAPEHVRRVQLEGRVVNDNRPPQYITYQEFLEVYSAAKVAKARR